MKVLVTGGAGFIGSHLIDFLVKRGFTVVSLDNMSTGTAFPKSIEMAKRYHIDITKGHQYILSLLKNYNIDYVFHLAAQVNLRKSIIDPNFDASNNIIGTINLLKACQEYGKVKKIVFTSTGGAMYDVNDSLPWSEMSHANPQSPYGLSKKCAEQYIALLSPCPYVIMRLSNVYGPRQNAKGEAGVISIFIENILNNLPLTIFGNGMQTRDYIYVHDVIKALELAISSDDLTGIYNVSTAIETNVNNIANLVIAAIGYIKYDVLFKPAIASELARSCLSYNKLQKQAKWKPMKDLKSGIEETVLWFTRHHGKAD